MVWRVTAQCHLYKDVLICNYPNSKSQHGPIVRFVGVGTYFLMFQLNKKKRGNYKGLHCICLIFFSLLKSDPLALLQWIMSADFLAVRYLVPCFLLCCAILHCTVPMVNTVALKRLWIFIGFVTELDAGFKIINQRQRQTECVRK